MPDLPILVLNSGSSSIKFSVYESGEDEPKRLFEGAVDGIGTDQGEFWITDAEDKKLVDQTPALPSRQSRSNSWKMRSVRANSLLQRPSAIVWFAEARRCRRTSALRPR